MFEWIFYPWMISSAYTLLIIYARIDLTPIYIYSMLVLFTCCWGSDWSIQAEVGKLNEDLHQPSGIRYEVWSFNVRCLISIAYWKGLIFGVKLSIVVPKAIGISLCNRIGDTAGDVPCFYLGFAGTMGLILLTWSWFLSVSMSHFIVCLSIDTPLYWFGLGLLFTTAFSVCAGFWPKVAYIRGFLAKSRVHT